MLPYLPPTPREQEEVEQAELEQAIAMSLALEAKRVELGNTDERNGTGRNECGVDVAINPTAGRPNREKRGEGRGSQLGGAVVDSEVALRK